MGISMIVSKDIIDNMLKDLEEEILRLTNIVNYKVRQFWKYEFLMIEVLWKDYDIEEATWEIGEKNKTRISVLVWGYR